MFTRKQSGKTNVIINIDIVKSFKNQKILFTWNYSNYFQHLM